MSYISECCGKEAVEHSLKSMVQYLLPTESIESPEQKTVWFGRCSGCFDQIEFRKEGE